MANGQTEQVDAQAVTAAWSRAQAALEDGNQADAIRYGVKALELDPGFRVHAPVHSVFGVHDVHGTASRRVTGHELVPHTWALYVPHLEVVAVTRSFWDEFTTSAEIHRFAERIGEFTEPAWIRYDPWVWMMHIEYSRGDPFTVPLAWPE
ncbi:hypothetical protein [Kineosporia babensis]|uniref:Tetratricopeptide repeat protein n=1 Tax=Kineosporia babensis TaxID=499548 RepID=A0A9X1N999_9ACTN|nr:hypothetical protein [Kineosporia babensis]MCD5309514.1 hypothetical protein [Kineosporia babensis]